MSAKPDQEAGRVPGHRVNVAGQMPFQLSEAQASRSESDMFRHTQAYEQGEERRESWS